MSYSVYWHCKVLYIGIIVIDILIIIIFVIVGQSVDLEQYTLVMLSSLVLTMFTLRWVIVIVIIVVIVKVIAIVIVIFLTTTTNLIVSGIV